MTEAAIAIPTSTVLNSVEAFAVSLDLFDGPIDLLLHLVKKNELPIEKVSLSEVASQYLACLEAEPHLDLEVAGEYLVVAATLLSIKSSFLLNEPPELVEDDEGNLVDPHDELLSRLREAAIYRAGADKLGTRPLLGVDVFESPSRLGRISMADQPLCSHEASMLARAFQKLLKDLGMRDPYTINLDGFSVVEEMMHLLETLKSAAEDLSGDRHVSFRQLIRVTSNRRGLVTTFLALLELCKRCILEVLQTEVDGEIRVGLRQLPEQVDRAAFDSEFDLVEGKVLVNG